MAVEWTITIEGRNEFGDFCRKEVRIDKSWGRLFDGDIGLSIDEGKKIMAALQSAAVNDEAETYALFRMLCGDCHPGMAFAIEYLQEHPEAGLCCEDGDWWVTPNSNDTDQRALLLEAAEAERLKEDARLRLVSGIPRPGRLLWVGRRMT